MKIGIILFIIGFLLLVFLIKVNFTKEIIKNIGIALAVLMLLYGMIIIVQPSDDNFIKYTKTTIVKK